MKRLFRLRPRGQSAIRAEMREEIESHVALACEQLVMRGYPPDEAMRKARARFGDFEAAMTTLYQSAETREGTMRRREYWSAIRQDLLFSLRQMRSTPVIAAAITVTLALGIGANLVMFSIANRLLFSPPIGVVDAGELRVLDLPQGGNNPRSTVTNYATYRDLQHATSFANLGGYGWATTMSLGKGLNAQEVFVNAATASFFPTIGVKPEAGRFFLPEEDMPPRGMPVAIISHAFWARRFGGEPTAIGQPLDINGKRYRVVGVLPPHFNGLDLKPTDVWLPMTDQSAAMGPDFATDRGSKWMMLVARLRGGVSDDRAIAEVSRLFALANAQSPQLVEGIARPAGSDQSMKAAGITTAAFQSIIPGRNAGPGGDAARVSAWLVGVATIVLIIACANVATLLLTRAMRRTAEMAVRLALGVSRRRLVAQLIGESALFVLAAGAVALLAAYLSRGIIQSVLLPETDLGPLFSWPLIVIGVAVITVICLVTSIAPALQVMRVDLATSLRGAGGRFTDGRNRLRATLLVVQVAMSALLLIGAGLFVRSLQNARGERFGIDMDSAMLAQVAVSQVGYTFDQQNQFWDAAVRRVRALPNVADAALTIGIPMRFSMAGRFILPGVKLPRLETGGPYRNGVDDRFFATTGTRILRGRGISANDVATSSPVVVVNETLARAVARTIEPMGQCVRLSAGAAPCATIVGIVEDISRNGLRESPSMQYYVPLTQWGGPHSSAMVVRAADGRGESLIRPVRRALQELSPDIPLPRTMTYSQLLDPQLRPWKMGATMFSLFGVLAFIVSVVGLYGLLAYSVAQRRFEFGIRTALGAQTRDIVRIVLKSALLLVTIGLVAGLGAAAAASRYASAMLYKVGPRDLMVYAGSAMLVLLVTAVVAAIPARRASAVNPTLALRGE